MTHVKNLLKRGALIAGAFLMTTQLWAQSNTTTDVVTTESGQVKGAVKDGVLAFKGIPFAAPPTGQLRWRAPQPVTPWTGCPRRRRVCLGLRAASIPFRRRATRHRHQ